MVRTSKLKIGYSPQVADMSHPADRRRLITWAELRGHKITTDLSARVDAIFLSGRADFAKIPEYLGRAPVIIDLIDGYLDDAGLVNDYARGVGKVVLGQISGPPQRYRTILSRAISLASATVCASVEQKDRISIFTNNCHVILDFHEEFPFLPFSELKDKRGHLMWEGQAFTASGLQTLSQVFTHLIKQEGISLAAVTDISSPRYFGHYGHRLTIDRIKPIPKLFGRDFEIIDWSIANVIENAKRSNVSIIPLDNDNFLNSLKPENRLLIMWRLGLPCLVSPTLAYSRVMKEAGLDSICQTEKDWEIKLIETLRSASLQRVIVEKGQAYIREKHSLAGTLNKWDEVFEGVL